MASLASAFTAVTPASLLSSFALSLSGLRVPALMVAALPNALDSAVTAADPMVPLDPVTRTVPVNAAVLLSSVDDMVVGSLGVGAPVSFASFGQWY